MLYQTTRLIGDSSNGLDLPAGCYVDTDCENWVKRMGKFLRPLRPGEQPKPTIKMVKVTQTLEDTIKVAEPITSEVVEEAVSSDEEVTESEEDVVGEEKTSSRKARPVIRRTQKA